MIHPSIIVTGAAVCLLGCNGGEPDVALAEPASERPAQALAAAPVCTVANAGSPLPSEVRETSGLAQSRRDPGRFWTHNDKGNTPDLFAVDSEGRLVQQVRVAGAESTDWEDIEMGPCDGGDCLYVADIGDNDAEREGITIYRIPEPDAGASETARAVAMHGRFPDGARDAEGLFVLPSGDLFIVTKGRRGEIALYRYPPPQQPGEAVTLERVRKLFPEPDDGDDRVTAATASPDGRWVGIRSNHSLYLYPAADLVGNGPVAPTVVDLEPLDQAQGESLVISADGAVWLTSEAGGNDDRPRWARLQCTFSDA